MWIGKVVWNDQFMRCEVADPIVDVAVAKV